MSVVPGLALQAQLTAGVWSDLIGDNDVIGQLRARYGISGNGPKDRIASSGQLEFSLKNGLNASGGVRGYYSPASASKRAGWNYGVTTRLRITDPADAAKAVSSITRVSGTATVTTGAAHGYATGDWVIIAGANQSDYNGTFQITVAGATTFTYAVSNAPATPATGTITTRKTYIKFYGKIAAINPLPGIRREQRCDVVAYDIMADLMDADLREVVIQIAQQEDTLIGAVLDALPSQGQPRARSIDAGVDTFPYAFDKIGAGQKAGGALTDLVMSSLGMLAIKGDGTLIYKNRHTIVVGSSAYSVNDSMQGLAVPSTIDRVYNRVRVTIHPKSVDAAATTVIAQQTGTPAQPIAAGDSLTIWLEFRDPSNTLKLIGGTSAVTPIVATTDYLANSAADGSGSNLTANISVVTTAFASNVKFVVTNGGATAAYITKLQLRGKGIYDNGPQTFEAYTAMSYGDRPFSLDMPYQNDPTIGNSAALYLEAQYDDPTQQMEALNFVATDTAAGFTQALTREIGDRITVSETMTGLVSIDAFIRSIELIMLGPVISCRWGLAPTNPFGAWQLGIAGASELGVSTILAF